MRLTIETFRRLHKERPGALFIFEEGDRYYILDFQAVVASRTLGIDPVQVTLADHVSRAVILQASELTSALSTIKRQHFGITVEIIRDAHR